MNRDEQVHRLKLHTGIKWDIIIIGGGATGTGLALDAVTRGYKPLLLEQSDFAGGTSSRSTKLVHGGVRYLAQGDILLVMEALRERGRILKNAPHLTSDQEFIIPVYTWFDLFLYTVGLKFYDLLAGRLSLGKSYFINRKKCCEKLPNVKQEGLKGGVIYHDGLFDDSRMTLSLARSCVEKGGIILNYFKVTELIKDENGKVAGVKVHDLNSGSSYKLRSKLVINATGVFADNILRLDNPDSKPIIRPSQGVHVVLDSSFLRSDSAIMIPKTDDGRVLFAIPWYGKVVIGTTDTPLDRISPEPVALEEEIRFILNTAERYLLKSPAREDILSVFAGLRPLASDPDNPQLTREISRRHKIILSTSDLLTITGGKWTTYRQMAEETINRAIKAGILERKKCITKTYKLNEVSPEVSSGHLGIYGAQAVEIDEIISDDPELGMPLSPSFPYTKAEIMWICRNEMPVKVEDMLARRTRALFLDARSADTVAPEVAAIMAQELGFDEKWQREQIESFRQLVKNYL